jgi:uncharacterized protein
MIGPTVLQRSLASMGRVLLGYSGGVDSTLLAVVATETLGPDHFLAVIGRSASYPAVQWRTAQDIARRFSIPLCEIETHELDDPNYRANPTDRCYFCKAELWEVMGRLARELKFDTLVDGANADDLTEHRPGLRAAAECHVRSPLAELGWTKAMVRAAARELGIPIWDAPAAPCLSSRVRYGLTITPARLEQVERGEALLRSLGIPGDLRVRHLGNRATIEVNLTMIPVVRERWADIEPGLRALGFAEVELDPHGYQRGNMLSAVDQPGL